jgi:hypothetical protein
VAEAVITALRPGSAPAGERVAADGGER